MNGYGEMLVVLPEQVRDRFARKRMRRGLSVDDLSIRASRQGYPVEHSHIAAIESGSPVVETTALWVLDLLDMTMTELEFESAERIDPPPRRRAS